MSEEWKLPEVPRLLHEQTRVSFMRVTTVGNRVVKCNKRMAEYTAHYQGVPIFESGKWITRAEFRNRKRLEAIFDEMRQGCEYCAMGYTFCGPFPAPPSTNTPQAQQEYQAALDLYKRKSEWFKREITRRSAKADNDH